MVSSEPNKEEIFDLIRKKWVVASPEEKVRQSLLHLMIKELFFPKELLSVEKAIREIPSVKSSGLLPPDRRVDVVCFARGIHPNFLLYPLLIIECKESIEMKNEAKQQVIGYNHFIKACFVAIAYPEGVEWGYFDTKSQSYQFREGLPSYLKLFQAVSRADAT